MSTQSFLEVEAKFSVAESTQLPELTRLEGCLLYTSDAADE